MQDIKNVIQNRKKLSNCFAFFNEICKWHEDGVADFYLVDDLVFVFKRANGFFKFYYYINELSDIKMAKPLLDRYINTSKVSLEITNKDNDFLQKYSGALADLGFDCYAHFVRMTNGEGQHRVFDPNKSYIADFSIATQEDVDELLDIMHENFDPIKDDILQKDELSKIISNGGVLVRKVDKKIIFLQIYEHTKMTLYSRMTWVKKEFRKPKYSAELYGATDEFARKLMGESLNFRSYFWVDKNIKNYKIALAMGGILDGLNSYIFVYKENK